MSIEWKSIVALFYNDELLEKRQIIMTIGKCMTLVRVNTCEGEELRNVGKLIREFLLSKSFIYSSAIIAVWEIRTRWGFRDRSRRSPHGMTAGNRRYC
jgi:hypothetical protein